MNLTTIKKLPAFEELIQHLPMSEKGFEQIAKDTEEVKDILAGKDNRLLVIIGPCSAWPQDAVLEYAKNLKTLEARVRNNLKLVMRVYIQKPRTGKGWTGPINQPDLSLPPDIEKGMYYCREMMIKIVELGLPIADEALFTHGARGFLELLSYVAIGARSSEDQEHRVFASAIDCAAGMKNPTSGSLQIAVNSVLAVQNPHIAVFSGSEVETHGNLHAHLVLRGGEKGPNYSAVHIEEAYKKLLENNVKNPAIVIDASHDNSKVNGVKSQKQQIEVVRDVMETLQKKPELRKAVRGFMIESFIKEGKQNIEPYDADKVDLGGLSVTDPCLGWEQTEDLILTLNDIKKNL
jgi:3-deoxy-7-phosphoheptulonate synthase